MRRLFETLVESNAAGSETSGRRTLPVSVTLHAGALVALVLVPLLSSSELPQPTSSVRAFFTEPAVPAPPPPPPPPPAGGARRTQTTPPPTQTFRAPAEVPTEIVEEEASGLGVLGDGVPEGVPDGVPNGVPYSIGDNLGEPPPPTEPVHVGGKIKPPAKIKDVAPVYPAIAKPARVQGIVILECTIDPQGRVRDVKVLRGIPLLDQAALDAVKQWVYTPTLLNGVPVPVIMTVTVNFRLQ
jgi:protein TonB